MTHADDEIGTPHRADAPFPLNSRHLPLPEVRTLPAPPRKLWRIIGPGIVAAGVGLSSGEFILWPYIASQAGLVFLWGAVVGVVTQWFLNMEIERYTLATGETAITGFNRYWRHWGAVLVALTYAANLWPGWATGSATMLSYVFGGNPTVIAVCLLLLIGAILTLAPVVYTALERLLFVKVALIGGFFALAVILAIKASSWKELPEAATHIGQFPSELGVAVLMGALAYAGAGGGQNLCQSNWIRDKGFGMGHYVPRLVSPVTGKEEAGSGSAAGYVFVPEGENLVRWKRWWRFANTEQAVTFGLATVVTIVLSSLLAHSTLFGTSGLSNDVGFVREEGEVLQSQVGGWFGVLFWLIGAFSLFSAATGIVDYTSRLAADVLKSTYLRGSRLPESRLYFWLVWGLVAIGVTILALGLDQPLVLLVVSACVAGLMMFVYSGLLLYMNRKALPAPLKVRSYRAAALVWAVGLFGVLSVLTVRQQIENLFG
ncbi:Nramp family divalent metal transporter [Streptomyces sp. PSKA54]|uniref:Nramp family divalent metal transporter n=1 Tax=Streptomyces himalayensis subsp. aureolus TaxID=2758039 RepID=A0A7W2D4J0_9ACTN|nr:Nramp family divalent metal transporter [Streptomyces himalayensis]MBA4864642.1 Nramp family divalent metal transporter [Streptomyces himalayensis subsp. aureolus]